VSAACRRRREESRSNHQGTASLRRLLQLLECLFASLFLRFFVVHFMERILIVEDELPMRTALQDVLAGEGYRVLTAADGESGLRRALEEKPDLILLDIMMPKLDGFAVCAELRRRDNPVPILMLTAKGQVEDPAASDAAIGASADPAHDGRGGN